MTSRLNWNESALHREIREQARKHLLRVGFQVEAQAKVNITNNGQVDTGFLRNSVYVTGGGDSSYGRTDQSGRYNNRQGYDVERILAPEMIAGPDEVLVVAGAEYAIHVETSNSFLYRALEQVTGDQR